MATRRLEIEAVGLQEAFPTVVRASGAQPSICNSTDTDDRGGNVLDLLGVAVTRSATSGRAGVVHSDDDLPVGATISQDVTSDGEIAPWKWAGRR
jgi:hypothetical protein